MCGELLLHAPQFLERALGGGALGDAVVAPDALEAPLPDDVHRDADLAGDRPLRLPARKRRTSSVTSPHSKAARRRAQRLLAQKFCSSSRTSRPGQTQYESTHSNLAVSGSSSSSSRTGDLGIFSVYASETGASNIQQSARAKKQGCVLQRSACGPDPNTHDLHELSTG